MPESSLTSPRSPSRFRRRPSRTPPRSCAASNSGPASGRLRRTRAWQTCRSGTASRPTTGSALKDGSTTPSSWSTCSQSQGGLRCCPARAMSSCPNGYRRSTPTSRTGIGIPAGSCQTRGPRAESCRRAAPKPSSHYPATGTRSRLTRTPWRSLCVGLPRHSLGQAAGSVRKTAFSMSP